MTKSLIRTRCSSCSADLKIEGCLNVSALIPSNGKRGAGHVPAHRVHGEVDGDDDLLTWDCPACGYADSFDLND